MGALIRVYRPAPMLGDVPIDRSPSDHVDHIVVTSLRGSTNPIPGETAYKLMAHDRYPRHPMLVPIGTNDEPVMCGPSGNFAGSEGAPGWCEAVEKITGGVSNLVAIYDDGFVGGAK